MGSLLLCKAKPKFDFHKRKYGLCHGYLRNCLIAISRNYWLNACFTVFYIHLAYKELIEKLD
jgi:hypothetical protein